MTTDIHNQKLFNEGVNQTDYIAHKNWYEECPECNGHFSLEKKEIPNLLKCGHVSCDECVVEKTPCPCCDRPKVLWIRHYKRLLGVSEGNSVLPNKEEPKLYNFHIIITRNYKAMDVMNKPATTTFEQIFKEFNEFVEFEADLKNRIGIVIGSKQYFYESIKNRPIGDFADILYTTKQRRTNSISVLDRKLGGQEQQ